MSVFPVTELSQASQDLLAKIFPDPQADITTYNVFKYLCLCFDTPRPSSKEEGIRNRLIAVADRLGLAHEVDSVGNLIIRQPASPGYEDRVRVSVQSHLDMVCSTSAQHDFDKDPIVPYVTDDGKWLQARDTTLGADDGIGVATAMAFLEEYATNPNFVHGPFEALFTTEEETTMGGALGLAPAPFMTAQCMINLDSEDDKKACVGCAGGAEVKLCLPITRTPVTIVPYVPSSSSSDDDSSLILVELKIFNLLGGHSGCDIQIERGNSIKIVSSLLTQLPNISLVSFNGGNAVNAIPRSATAQFVIPASQYTTLSSLLQDTLIPTISRSIASAELTVAGKPKPTEEELSSFRIQYTFTPVDLPSSSLSIGIISPENQVSFTSIINEVPHGPLVWSTVLDNTVETSNALTLTSLPSYNLSTGQLQDNTTEDVAIIHSFFRSFVDEQLPIVGAQIETIGTKYGAIATPLFNEFPGWAPALDNALYTATLSAYDTTFYPGQSHDEPTYEKLDVYSVHAGLECGCIKKSYPDLAAVSIGPLILDAHSPVEKLHISSVAPYIAWTKEIITQLAQIKAEDF